MKRIYLDYNATTPLDPRVRDVMLPFLDECFGNASSLHWFGQQARAAVDEARGQVARLLGATPSEIVFTSSGTEADSMALRGVTGQARGKRRKIVCSALEHHAVVKTATALAKEGWPVETVGADTGGRLDLDQLRAHVDDKTLVVAVMLANNETGVIQPLEEVVGLARAKGALVLCDAVQALGKIPVDVKRLDVDLLALSGHKMYGPKGAGALYVKRGTQMTALLAGGSQERNRRAGTENVAGIVGLGCAAELAGKELPEEAQGSASLRDRLEERLLALPGSQRNGTEPRVPNTSNLSFEGIDAESLLMALDLMGVAVSTGAACAAGAVEPSHVLRAMGLPGRRIEGSIRFSVGRTTTQDEIDCAAEAVGEAVERQRRQKRASRKR